MFDAVLKIILMGSTIGYACGEPLPKFDLIFFQMAMFSLLIAASVSKQKRNFCDNLITSLFLITGASLFFSKFDIIPLSSFFNLSLGLLGIITVTRYCDDPKACQKFIIYAALANIFIFIIQKFGWSPIFDFQITTGEEGGIMGNAGRLSTYLAIAMPFFTAINPISFILFYLIGLFNKEAGLLVVALVCTFIPLYKKNRWLTCGGLIALISISAYFLYDEILNISIANRLPIWKNTIEQIFKNPLTGWGLTSRPLVTSDVLHVVNQKPDFIFSSFLQFIFSLGVTAVIWIIYMLKEFRKRFDSSPEAMAVLAILILSIFKYPIEIHRIWITMVAVIGFFFIRTNEREALCS